jgi:hypothetical protein
MPNIINIGRDFSRYPAGRQVKHGPFSGERFRNEFLIPYLQKNLDVTVELDDTAGYGSSFLEEAFGGLLRSGLTVAQVDAHLHLRSADQSLLDEIQTYIHKQSQRN